MWTLATESLVPLAAALGIGLVAAWWRARGASRDKS
jgi:hypothetical protein